jgi:histidinol-phosphate/aromatic aminotransferase/cobyric acid decarboxylase-like protein
MTASPDLGGGVGTVASATLGPMASEESIHADVARPNGPSADLGVARPRGALAGDLNGARTAGTPTRDLTAGQHGGDGRRIASALGLDLSQVLDLSASLNEFAPDPAAIVARHLGALHDYPDAHAATAAMADAIGVAADRLVLTNGGAEAIALVAAELREGHVVEPEFSLYRRHLARVDAAAGRWRSNPASPLGHLAGPDARAEVWDEAFYPLATGDWTRGDDDSWRLGSLTKLWRCPGLRLGYVIAPTPEAAQAIARRQPRWSVNGMALASLPDFLAITDLPGWAADIAHTRETFTLALRELGLTVVPSAANWVLVSDALHLRLPLATRGIIVRDCANFGLPDTIRVALPSQRDMDRVLAAFQIALSSTRATEAPTIERSPPAEAHLAATDLPAASARATGHSEEAPAAGRP